MNKVMYIITHGIGIQHLRMALVDDYRHVKGYVYGEMCHLVSETISHEKQNLFEHSCTLTTETIETQMGVKSN